MPARAEDSLATRRTLLSRLRDLDDASGWREFFDRYWRLIYNVARKAGLGDADAQDLVQDVLVSLAKKMPGFRYDPARGRFKNFLLTVVHSRLVDAWERERTGQTNLLNATGDYDGDEYLSDTNPLDPGDRFRITDLALDFDPVVEFTLTFTSRFSRCYVIEFMDYTGGAPSGTWLDSGLGGFCGDGDATTTRTFAGTAPAQRIFRNRAMRPLTP